MTERKLGVLVTIALVACKPTAQEPPWPALDVSTNGMLRGHVVTTTTAQRAPRYQRPTCVPAYEWRATMSSRMDGAGDADELTQRLEARSTFELRADPTSPTRATIAPTMFELAMATANSGRGAPVSGVLPTSVELDLRDGRRWVEVNGPRSMWSALGTFSGVSLFFPEIPAGDRSESWTLTAHAPSEARRDAQPVSAVAGDEVAQRTLAFRSRIARWITVDGQRAAVVQAHAIAPDGRAHRANIETVVTEQGIVLASAVRLHTFVRSTVDQRTLTWTGEVSAELRLRGGCPGPSLASGFPAASPRERALVAYGRLLRAVNEDRRDEALSTLDPSLIAAHNGDVLWSLLRAYVTDRGPRALGSIELADDPGRTQANELSMKIHGAGRVRDSANLSLDVDLGFALSDDRARVRRIGVSSVQGSTEHDLLEIDARVARGALAERAPGPSVQGSPFTALAPVDAGVRRRGVFDALGSAPPR